MATLTNLHIHIIDKSYSVSGILNNAIKNLDLAINQNEFVCLVGPSGCGKTTLLNIVAGLDKQFAGSIYTDAKNAHPHIGYVFQNPRLLPWYTVRQNIEIVFPGTIPTRLINSLLNEMQLTEVENYYPERLSLGMQRRVSIIRAFAINPDLLLMDEPFVSLDAPNARNIRQSLYTLWLQRPHTVLFASHDLREAIALADRLIFLSAAPMNILADIPVTIDRLQRNNTTEIESFRQHLLQNFPIINNLF